VICKCGHREDVHYKEAEWMSGYIPGMCTSCEQSKKYHEYKADNLRYLEELSNGRE